MIDLTNWYRFVVSGMFCLVLSMSYQSEAGAPDPPAPAGLSFSFVDSAQGHGSGPDHDFRVAAYEVTNEQFVAFLNDAMNNLGNERGQFLRFDTTTGIVYLQSAATGTAGPGGSGTMVFDPDVNPYVTFERNAFLVAADGELHPVVGVSWFGALKFCNWLTIDAGLAPADRAYGETSSATTWRPVSISAAIWQSGSDLSAPQRQAMTQVRGFRLPMDGGIGADHPSLYNEWYMAAGWDPTAMLHSDYGFGDSDVMPNNCNFLNSFDTFEKGTTPTGYYNGDSYGDPPLFDTVNADNPYNLYDITGNVWEWMQDRTSSPSQRAIRGGSFLRTMTSPTLLNINRSVMTAASVNNSTGFRVVQSIPDRLWITPAGNYEIAGHWGGPYLPDDTLPAYTIYNLSDLPVSVDVGVDVGWLLVNGGVEIDTIPGGGSVEVTSAPALVCEDQVASGTHTITLTITNESQGSSHSRLIIVELTEPLSVTPKSVDPFSLLPGKAADDIVFSVTNDSASTVTWSAEVVDLTDPTPKMSWVSVIADEPLDGAVLSGGLTATVTARFDFQGQNDGVYRARIDFTNECTGEVMSRDIEVSLHAPFGLTDPDSLVAERICEGPLNPDSFVFMIDNDDDAPINVAISVEGAAAAWLIPDTSLLTIDAGASQEATLTIDADGIPDLTETPQDLVAVVRFVEESTGATLEREITVHSQAVIVQPEGPATFTAFVGDDLTNLSTEFTLHNVEDPNADWSVTIQFDPPLEDPEVPWLTATPAAGGFTKSFETADVTLSVAPAATLLSSGLYTATVSFEHSALWPVCFASRIVTLQLNETIFSLDMATVPGSDGEGQNLPTYDFRIGKREISNGEFVRFLNDAITDFDGLGGQFMQLHSPSGQIHISQSPTGGISTDPPPPTDERLMFRPSIGGGISYDGTRFLSTPGKANLPVVGVTWYGAAKFANWMTIVQGMDSLQRRYTESGDPAGWTALPGGLGDEFGYRLPMDGGMTGANPANEWYKSAAWQEADESFRSYGFGRDTITGADANFIESGDPFAGSSPQLTPVAYYDGTTHGSFVTNPNDNAYGCFDFSGNVREWMHDGISGPGGNYAMRGGSWTATSANITTLTRTTAFPHTANGWTGFRVAQDIDDVPPLVVHGLSGFDSTDFHAAVEGIVGGSGAITEETSGDIIYSLGSSPAANEYRVTGDQPWLLLNGASEARGFLAADELTQIEVTFASSLGALPLEVDPVTLLPIPNVASLTFEDITRGVVLPADPAVQTFTVSVTMVDSMEVTPVNPDPFVLIYGEPVNESLDFVLRPRLDDDIPYSASVDVSWLRLDGSVSVSGTLADGEEEVLTLELQPVAATLTSSDLDEDGLPIPYQGTVLVTNVASEIVSLRFVQLIVEPPIISDDLNPIDFGYTTWLTLPDPMPADVSWDFSNRSTETVAFSVATPASWLTVTGGGTCPAGQDCDSVSLSLNEQVSALAIGMYEAAVTISGDWGSVERNVLFEVRDPLAVDDTEAMFLQQETAGPVTPPAHSYTIENKWDDQPIEWSVSADVDWIWFEGTTGGELEPGASVSMPIAIDPDSGLEDGVYWGTLTFHDATTDEMIERQVQLTRGEGVVILPAGLLHSTGRQGGWPNPLTQAVTIQNYTAQIVTWEARIVSGMGSELILPLSESGPTTLLPTELAQLEITWDQAQTGALPVGDHSAMISIDYSADGINPGTVVREMQLNVTAPATFDMEFVNPETPEAGGPTHLFEVARHEVTNRLFADFLNDARVNPEKGRSDFMYYDTVDGRVFIDNTSTGGTPATKMFDPAASSGISFDNRRYLVAGGLETHPVVGVSWYGAIKFCNWLTIDRQLGHENRCYLEGPAIGDWRPVSIAESGWSNRDLNDDERLDLVTNYPGYRLPMDDGAGNSQASVDSPDLYNEWYMAAAFDPQGPTTQRIGPGGETVPAYHWIYGFGRDTFSSADANYRDSGDPFEPGTSIVGYFTGALYDTFQTNPNNNAFGLHDVSGNVWEWVQDKYNGGSGSRAIRGGSWFSRSSDTCWMDLAGRCLSSPATTSNQIGLRLARAVHVPTFDIPGDFDSDGDVDLVDFQMFQLCFSGTDMPWTGDACAPGDTDFDGDVDLVDFGGFQLAFTGQL
jgi:formylglycine-generating enzyme required for sulfatase activity